MNQIIKELMLEAGYAAPEIALRAQKLAELIIKESCSQIFVEVQDQRDQQFYDRVTTNIKKHFGVR